LIARTPALAQHGVKLLEIILRQMDDSPGIEDRIHHFGISRNFLLVAAGEGLTIQAAEHFFNLGVSQRSSFNARG
jgi:hypothetical protein